MSESDPDHRLQCGWIEGEYLVVRLPATDPLPDWVVRPPGGGGLWSITDRDGERSLCCPASIVPPDAESIGPYRGLSVEAVGAQEPPLPPTLIGVLAQLTQTLATIDVPVLAISTFDTDVLLVPSDVAWRAGVALGMDRP